MRLNSWFVLVVVCCAVVAHAEDPVSDPDLKQVLDRFVELKTESQTREAYFRVTKKIKAAIEKQDIAALKQALEEARANSVSLKNMPYFIEAFKLQDSQKSNEIIQLLLANGADINSEQYSGLNNILGLPVLHFFADRCDYFGVLRARLYGASADLPFYPYGYKYPLTPSALVVSSLESKLFEPSIGRQAPTPRSGLSIEDAAQMKRECDLTMRVLKMPQDQLAGAPFQFLSIAADELNVKLSGLATELEKLRIIHEKKMQPIEKNIEKLNSMKSRASESSSEKTTGAK